MFWPNKICNKDLLKKQMQKQCWNRSTTLWIIWESEKLREITLKKNHPGRWNLCAGWMQKIYLKSKCKNSVGEIKQRRMRWLGHVLRMAPNRIPEFEVALLSKKVLEYCSNIVNTNHSIKHFHILCTKLYYLFNILYRAYSYI
jgi:hypothetical protein